MDRRLLNLFKNIYDRQDQLAQATNYQLFKDYSNSEVHLIDLIGRLDQVNGVVLAQELGLTRGAISKISKKLSDKNLIEAYQLEGNKKEVYYRLTDQGLQVFKDHDQAHKAWEDRELNFFRGLDPDKKDLIEEFLEDYQAYLDQLIREEGIK